MRRRNLGKRKYSSSYCHYYYTTSAPPTMATARTATAREG
jgi:hypothetical protein